MTTSCPACGSTTTRPIEGRGDGLLACAACWTTFDDPSDLCNTCRSQPASFLAHHEHTGDTWQVCSSCQTQAVKHEASVIHHPLDAKTEAS